MAKIDITISSSGTSKNTVDQEITGKKIKKGVDSFDKETPSMRINEVSDMLDEAARNAIKASFYFAKSNYGNFTGDYIGQQQIDNAFGVATCLVGFGSTIAAGFKTGGLVGASAAAIVTSIAIGTSAVQNVINYNQSILKSNFSSSFNAQRIGTVLHGGNRE